MRCEKLFSENFLHLLLYDCLYFYTVIYYIRGRENRPTTKKKDRKTTMERIEIDKEIKAKSIEKASEKVGKQQ